MTQLEFSLGDAPEPVGSVPDLAWLRAQGILSALDERFARSLAAAAGVEDPRVIVATALVSRQVRHGHVRLDLEAWRRNAVVDEAGRPVAGLAWPAARAWSRAVGDSKLGSAPGTDDGSPLIVDDGGHVYLRRLFMHERSLAASLLDRARRTIAVADPEAVAPTLDALFGAPTSEPNWPKVAALVALSRPLCVVTGGPGTGKTTTVAKILAALASLSSRGTRPLRMQLLAPTGKAARRLADAVNAAVAGLPLAPAVRDAIPSEAVTLHRALRPIRGNLADFRHHGGNPLPADVVVVDEASMVDLALMERLVAAVRPDARLVLLGDADQLVSIEAGAAFGDLCRSGHPYRPGRALVDAAERFGERMSSIECDPSPIADCIVRLQRSWRFDEHSALGSLARAVLAGEGKRVLEILDEPDFATVGRLEPPTRQGAGYHPGFARRVVAGYGPLVGRAKDDEIDLSVLDRFKILCAHRGGPEGVEQLNVLVEAWLAQAGGMAEIDRRPVLVTANDYAARLFNGDVGLWVQREGGAGRVAFPAEDGMRWFARARLPSHEAAFAMSVHKSQGSEFDQVALMLPSVDSPLLSRELLYTAVTRARREVWVHGRREIIARAVERPVQRSSGLRALLWGGSEP